MVGVLWEGVGSVCVCVCVCVSVSPNSRVCVLQFGHKGHISRTNCPPGLSCKNTRSNTDACTDTFSVSFPTHSFLPLSSVSFHGKNHRDRQWNMLSLKQGTAFSTYCFKRVVVHPDLSQPKTVHATDTYRKSVRCWIFFFFTPEGAFSFLADAVAAGIFYWSCLSICQSHSEEKDISQIGERSFFKFGTKCSLELKNELIRFWWSKVTVFLTSPKISLGHNSGIRVQIITLISYGIQKWLFISEMKVQLNCVSSYHILQKTLFWPFSKTITQEQKGRLWPYFLQRWRSRTNREDCTYCHAAEHSVESKSCLCWARLA